MRRTMQKRLFVLKPKPKPKSQATRAGVYTTDRDPNAERRLARVRHHELDRACELAADRDRT
jgi:hypothetical protein